MEDRADANAAVWQSADSVQAWAAEAERQERGRRDHRRFMAVLLPFAEQDEFTFLDLGAGTGAASRTILDLRPRSTAILADFSMIPLDQQLGYLRSAGFEGIDVYWKQLENVIYGGRRPR